MDDTGAAADLDLEGAEFLGPCSTRAGRGPAGHPERGDIRLLSEDFYAEPDERWAWMRATHPSTGTTRPASGAWRPTSTCRSRRDWQTFCSGKGRDPRARCRR